MTLSGDAGLLAVAGGEAAQVSVLTAPDTSSGGHRADWQQIPPLPLEAPPVTLAWHTTVAGRSRCRELRERSLAIHTVVVPSRITS